MTPGRATSNQVHCQGNALLPPSHRIARDSHSSLDAQPRRDERIGRVRYKCIYLETPSPATPLLNNQSEIKRSRPTFQSETHEPMNQRQTLRIAVLSGGSSLTCAVAQVLFITSKAIFMLPCANYASSSCEMRRTTHT